MGGASDRSPRSQNEKSATRLLAADVPTTSTLEARLVCCSPGRSTVACGNSMTPNAWRKSLGNCFSACSCSASAAKEVIADQDFVDPAQPVKCHAAQAPAHTVTNHQRTGQYCGSRRHSQRDGHVHPPVIKETANCQFQKSHERLATRLIIYLPTTGTRVGDPARWLFVTTINRQVPEFRCPNASAARAMPPDPDCGSPRAAWPVPPAGV